MSSWNWRNWSLSAARPSVRRDRRRRVEFETLEQRTVPATLDLTTRGAMGNLGDGHFRQTDSRPTIDSIVRLDAKGKATTEQGFNTDARPLQFDENVSKQFTRSLKLSELPRVNIGGVSYRELLLDISQTGAQPYLSLDELRVFTSNTGNLTGYNTTSRTLAGLPAVFDLDAAGDNWIKLDSRLNPDDGKGDMLAYIPESAFAGAGSGAYVYLYSKFGVNFKASGAAEQWAVGPSPSMPAIPPPPPAPPAPSLGAISGTVTDAWTGQALQGITIFLDLDRDGYRDGDEPFATTDENGSYAFNDLVSGLGDATNYLVGILPPDGAIPAPFGQYVWLDAGLHASNVNFTLDFSEEGPPLA